MVTHWGIIIAVCFGLAICQKKTTISECYMKKDHYFCNLGNNSIKKSDKKYETYGYCCPNKLFKKKFDQC